MKVIRSTIKLLRANKLLVPIFLFTSGCASSSYEVINHEGWLNELLVTPDRVSMECENLQTDDIVSYGFTLFVLDEKKTVLSVVQTNRIGESNCNERLRKIGKILKNGRRIYIAGIGDLEEPRKSREASHFFSKHGTFMENGRLLQFHAIANETGECFDAYSGSKKPCPQGHFPLKPAN